MYEIFEHTADLGIRVRASDLNTLFAEAGVALFSIIVTDLKTVRLRESRSFEITATDREYLLFDWLSELLFTFDTEHLVLAECQVDVADGALRATAKGEPFDSERHGVGNELKAITYHALKVEPDGDGWLAEVIVDI